MPSSAPWSSGPVSQPATAARATLSGAGARKARAWLGRNAVARRGMTARSARAGSAPVTNASTTASRASTARVRACARWRRLAWSIASAAVPANSRRTARSLAGEPGAIGQSVGVEHSDHATADLERDRHGRLDAAALRHEIREAREVVALAQQDGGAGLGDPARHAFAQARPLLPRLGLARRSPGRGRHPQVVSLDEHQRGFVGAERVGGPVHDVAEQLVRGDLVREEIERQLLDPEDLVPPLVTLARGPGRSAGGLSDRVPRTAFAPRVTRASQTFRRSSIG